MAEPTGDAISRARHAFSGWLKERRRARAKKGTGSRRLTYGILTGIVAVLVLFFWALAYLRPSTPGYDVSNTGVKALADNHRIASVEFRDEDNVIVGKFDTIKDSRDRGAKPLALGNRADESDPSFNSPANDGSRSGTFSTSIPSSGVQTNELLKTIRDSGASVSTDPQPFKAQIRIVTTFLLPLTFLALLFAFFFSLSKGGSSAIGEVMTFGSIGKGKVKKGQAGPITFESVGGADEAVAELREVRDYLTNPAKYEALGAAPPKGVLLFGPPGTGKTLLAKAVAGEAGVPFFSIAGAEFVESLVGVGAARVRDLFQRVRAAAPAIVFIDELDAAARKRGAGGGGGGSDEREQTLNQLLVEMDGFEVSSGIVVIGATNRPDILDPAILRPGRFDRHITIERPDHAGRLRIVQIHAQGKPVSKDVSFDHLADRTPGFTGADLANVVNEATLLAIRQGKTIVELPEFEEAILRVLSGPKRRGRLLSEDERRRAAYHESGHVVVSAAAGGSEEVHRVSILARGRQIATSGIRNENADSSLMSQSQLRGQLVTLCAGIAAENLVFGEGSTGGEQDLENATNLARDMVARYGMSADLGPVRLLAKSSEGFLNEDIPLADISYETRQALDVAIRRLIADAQADATTLLARHRKTLDGLAERLMAQETLEGDELLQVLAPIEKEMATEVISAKPVRSKSPSNGTRRTTRPRTGAGR